MPVYPKAIWKPLPESSTQPKITPRVAILHTAVSNADSLYGYFASAGIGVESHFYIRGNGIVEQYIDTSIQADANYHANGFAVSIETWDNKQIIPWTPEQLISIVDLLDWLCKVHPTIKRQACPSWNGSGIGYHSQYLSEWSKYAGKVCPGRPRIAQVGGIITAVQKLAVKGGATFVPEWKVINSTHYEKDMATLHTLQIWTAPDGRGWGNTPGGSSKLMGVTVAGSDPNRDKTYFPFFEVAAQPNANEKGEPCVTVTVKGAPPEAWATVYVCVGD